MVSSVISEMPKSETLSLKTPMMVKGMPRIWKVWPMAASALPYRSRAKEGGHNSALDVHGVVRLVEEAAVGHNQVADELVLRD